jgi:uncharacterized protein YlxW (UPF0749 family)
VANNPESGPALVSPVQGAAPRPPTRRPGGRRISRGSLTVGLVATLAGALFATSAALFRADGGRHPQNLAELVSVESDRLAAVTEDVDALRVEVTSLIEQERGYVPPTDAPGSDVDLASARVPVVGPGLVVRLWDAPTVGNPPLGARPDDLVVHQGDLEAVMNALWAGGAEAMMIQGNRVDSRTAVRCVGSVLLMATQTYSPPYEVAAIGDQAALRAALDDSPDIQVYLQYVEALDLGWSVESKDLIEMPAATGPLMQHAVVLEGGV